MRTNGKKSSGESKPEVLVLDMNELEDIVKRALSGPISEADGAKILSSLGSLAWLQQELTNKDVTLARLRSLFGLNTSEKTRDVLGDQSDDKSEDRGDGREKEPRPEPKKIRRNRFAGQEGPRRRPDTMT